MLIHLSCLYGLTKSPMSYSGGCGYIARTRPSATIGTKSNISCRSSLQMFKKGSNNSTIKFSLYDSAFCLETNDY